MDLLAELEDMAANVVGEPDTDFKPEIETIKRWQRLFHYSHAEAMEHINNHRGDLSRARISEEHWEMVRSIKEPKGYDREAYEYSMTLKKPHVTGRLEGQPSEFLLKLEGPLRSAAKVQEAAGLALVPVVISGTGDSGEEVNFRRVSGAAKKTILEKLSDIAFQPTFVRVSKAEKALSNASIYPTLGIDSTLPQHRPANTDPTLAFSPAQDQYAVWYFFYGTLADPDALSRLLSLSEKPEMRPASITGGVLRTWAGPYKAVVDAPASTSGCVNGCAYQIVSREHEEALQYYETEMYEVVRCLIALKDTAEIIKGLTFRFVNNSENLI
jgi:hypothetical protein